MATNKHASIRYNALDSCFGNFGRKFFIEDLIEACNEAIYNYSGSQNGIKRRQIFDDIQFMESEQGWSIPLERHKDGKRVYYRYEDRKFSIKNQPVNEQELEQIKSTIEVLNRFKGLPHFEWIEEISVRLNETFGRGFSNVKSVVSFEQNPYLKGLEYFSLIFNSINNKCVLNIEYQGFKQDKPVLFNIHPYHLKQYNNRWFLFGQNSELNKITNLALDRIVSIQECKDKFIHNDQMDFDEYFDDIVGVSYDENKPVEKITLEIANELWPYIESKPLHGSQTIKSKSKKAVLIELSIQVNHELIANLFSYMDSLEIIAPDSFRERIKTLSEAIYKKYI